MTRRNLFSDDADMTTVQATIKRMTKQLEVVVEAGVLRPLEPLPFAERQHLLVTVTDETTGGRAFNPRDREQVWLQGHRDEYAGQWVALDGDTLVAHGNDGSDVTQRAWEQGVAEPLVVWIPGEPELPFGGW
jgi:predicted DNA-binding antitoxin AbrB/MazE fold protein